MNDGAEFAVKGCVSDLKICLMIISTQLFNNILLQNVRISIYYYIQVSILKQQNYKKKTEAGA